MFKNASGGELVDKLVPAKAKAIDSSSMLSYNFFRNIGDNCSIVIDGIEYNKVFFEVQLRTLQVRSKPANIDVVLVSNDGQNVLFIESKFLEYLETDFVKFSDSYKNNDAYYEDNKEKGSLLDISSSFKNESERYNYGIKQNICHLIGISNLYRSKRAQDWFHKTYNELPELVILKAKSYRFINAIFCPKNKDASKLCSKYIKQLKDFQESLPSDIKKYTEPTFVINYKNIFDFLPHEMGIRDKLKKRYIDFHS